MCKDLNSQKSRFSPLQRSKYRQISIFSAKNSIQSFGLGFSGFHEMWKHWDRVLFCFSENQVIENLSAICEPFLTASVAGRETTQPRATKAVVNDLWACEWSISLGCTIFFWGTPILSWRLFDALPISQEQWRLVLSMSYHHRKSRLTLTMAKNNQILRKDNPWKHQRYLLYRKSYLQVVSGVQSHTLGRCFCSYVIILQVDIESGYSFSWVLWFASHIYFLDWYHVFSLLWSRGCIERILWFFYIWACLFDTYVSLILCIGGLRLLSLIWTALWSDNITKNRRCGTFLFHSART